MSTRASVALILLWAMVAGCGGESPRTEVGFFPLLSQDQRSDLAEQLAAGEAKWATAGASDYRAVVDQWTIGHVSRAELSVSGDSIVSMAGLPNDRGEAPILPLAPVLWLTISELFERARSAINEASSVVLELHPEMGYPEHLRIDYSASIFDDEVWFAVRELELLGTR